MISPEIYYSYIPAREKEFNNQKENMLNNKISSQKHISFDVFKSSLNELNCELYENISYETYLILMKAHNNNGYSSLYPNNNNYFELLNEIKSNNYSFIVLFKDSDELWNIEKDSLLLGN